MDNEYKPGVQYHGREFLYWDEDPMLYPDRLTYESEGYLGKSPDKKADKKRGRKFDYYADLGLPSVKLYGGYLKLSPRQKKQFLKLLNKQL